MQFEVLYTFVLDDEVKRPSMHVDIDDYDTGMRLLEIGAVVKVPEAPARPDTSARIARPRSLRGRSNWTTAWGG